MPDLPDISNIPYLPSPARDMNWRDLNRFKSSDRGSDFYKTCLDYSQVLWRQRLPARAILCLDRAWGADLTGDEPILESWPLPYQALVYILQNAPTEVFLGNPRIHFQHYADRLGEPRLEQRKWRSWACWALSCKARRSPGSGTCQGRVRRLLRRLLRRVLCGREGEGSRSVGSGVCGAAHLPAGERCLGRVSDVSQECLGSVSEASHRRPRPRCGS